MKKLLYYPNLEPPSTEWLKFSILYLEKFESIVPYNRQHLISDDYRRLTQETDLVSLYAPTYDQGERASLKAIEQTEKILNNPYKRSFLFNSVNIYRKWKDENNWNYTIYSEKFSHQWKEYCVNNKIARLTNDGLEMPKELAFLFMTYLAQEISHERNGSIITDNIEFDNYSNFSRTQSPDLRIRNKFMKGIINLLVPANISELSIDELIKFRNKNRERIKAFNHQVDIMESSISNGVTEKEFIKGFTNIYSELSREIILTGIGIASIPFATYMLINNQDALSAEYSKEILGGLGIGLGGYYTVKQALSNTREKRMNKRYFANLERLK